MQRKAGRGLLAVKIDIKPAHEGEMNRWYEEEHLPDRANCPGFLSARRFVVVNGDPIKYFAMYDLENIEVLQSEGYRKIASTPWTERIRSYYASPAWRSVYEEIAPAAAGPADGGTGIAAGRSSRRGLLSEGADIDPACEEEFNRWVETKHLPARSKQAGVVSARRFRKTEGPGPKWIAVYDLETAENIKPCSGGPGGSPAWEDHVRKQFGGTATQTIYREIDADGTAPR